MSYLLALEVEKTEQPETCKGLFYRYRERSFPTSKGFRFAKDLQLLKRMSCPGCPKCDAIFDTLPDDEYRIEYDDKLQDGDIARLQIVIDGYDWETGYMDSWHVVARKLMA